MTLKDCTKEELLFVIKQLKFYGLTSGDYYINRALLDVEERRADQRDKNARRFLACANRNLKEYTDLLAPYEGCRYIDIPDDVIEKATAAEKAYLSALKKWDKLMGL